jgi:hypothetical protein
MVHVRTTLRGSRRGRAWRLTGAALLGAVVPCAAVFSTLLAAGTAHAAPDDVGAHASPKVVVLSGNPTLDRALRMSLGPWRMRLEVVSARSPGSSMPISAMRARVLAQELSADALVWISDTSEGAALWVHDARTGNVTARSTPSPPFDIPTAAALALSVKTVLRASGLAPEGRDAGAEEPEPAPLPRTPVSRPPQVTPAEPPPPPEDIPEIERPPPREYELIALPEPTWQLVVHGAVRVGAFEPEENGARYGLQLRWSPWAEASSNWRRGLWFGLDAETSTPWVVSRPEFEGEYWDIAPGLCVGMMRPLSKVVQLGLQVTGSLHFVSLSGTLTSTSRNASIATQSPSVMLRPELGFRVGNVTFLLQPGVGTFMKRQAYLRSDVEFLETQLFWWMLGGAIALRAE